jgi:hypothetical protein
MSRKVYYVARETESQSEVWTVTCAAKPSHSFYSQGAALAWAASQARDEWQSRQVEGQVLLERDDGQWILQFAYGEGSRAEEGGSENLAAVAGRSKSANHRAN